METRTSKVVTLSFSTPSGAILVTLPLKTLVPEALNLDACRLAEVDVSDIGFVHFALNVDLVDVALGHHEGGGRAEDEDRADGIPDFDVAGEDAHRPWAR